LAAAGDAAADGETEATTKARLANAASAVLRPTLDFTDLSLILTSSALAKEKIWKHHIMRKAPKWFRDRGNLPRFDWSRYL
jgi:hypothetical protein